MKYYYEWVGEAGAKLSVRPQDGLSEKQINLMTKLRIQFKPGISAGEASELINARLKKAKVAAA